MSKARLVVRTSSLQPLPCPLRGPGTWRTRTEHRETSELDLGPPTRLVTLSNVHLIALSLSPALSPGSPRRRFSGTVSGAVCGVAVRCTSVMRAHSAFGLVKLEKNKCSTYPKGDSETGRPRRSTTHLDTNRDHKRQKRTKQGHILKAQSRG